MSAITTDRKLQHRFTANSSRRLMQSAQKLVLQLAVWNSYEVDCTPVAALATFTNPRPRWLLQITVRSNPISENTPVEVLEAFSRPRPSLLLLGLGTRASSMLPAAFQELAETEPSRYCCC